MAAKYILAVLSIAFLVASMRSYTRTGNWRHPQTRTWLLISAIFGGVSIWLFNH
jgi:hypothetical protein